MSHNQVIALPIAPKQRPSVCEYAGGYFRLTDQGLTFVSKDKDGHQLPPRWICSPLYVVAKTRDARSGEWGRLLEWQDDDGITHQWAMPLALLQGDASDVRRELARLGLAISPNRTARDLLTSYLQVFPIEARARCVDRLGWHGDVFVTASQSIGHATEQIVFQNTNAIEPALSSSGTAEEWRDSIGRLAAGNSRLVFAISIALAPVLAKLVGEDSGGFHLRGVLANGQGKTRASRTGTVKQSSKWSLFFLSAGEESLTSLMAKTGQRSNPGQEIRLADIEADAGAGMGVFETIHNQLSPASMALSLKKYSSRYHGAVGMAWLQHVVAKRQVIGRVIADITHRFVETVIQSNANGQMMRVARRFALVAAAGELASQFGLTGWKKDEAFQATQQCFTVWMDAFGAEGNREDRAIMAQVRGFFESYGASRFDNVRLSESNPKISNGRLFSISVI